MFHKLSFISKTIYSKIENLLYDENVKITLKKIFLYLNITVDRNRDPPSLVGVADVFVDLGIIKVCYKKHFICLKKYIKIQYLLK